MLTWLDQSAQASLYLHDYQFSVGKSETFGKRLAGPPQQQDYIFIERARSMQLSPVVASRGREQQLNTMMPHR